jgi:hypothetical protein
MWWVVGGMLIPFLLCGFMCVGGIMLAAVGLRRVTGATDRTGAAVEHDAGPGRGTLNEPSVRTRAR